MCSGYRRTTCVLSGKDQKSERAGISLRHWKKVGCSALIRASPVSGTDCKRLFEVFNHWEPNQTESNNANNLNYSSQHIINFKFCVCRTVNIYHNGHHIDRIADQDIILTSNIDIMEHQDLLSTQQGFMNISKRNNCYILKSWKHLQQLYPSVYFEYSAVKICIISIGFDEKDAEKIILNSEDLRGLITSHMILIHVHP